MNQSFLTAFSGTSIEFFETVAIAYALINTGYSREAISAVILGNVLAGVGAFFLWPYHSLVPVFWCRLAAAWMLVLLGLYWTAKSARRWLQGKRPRWVQDPLGKIGVSPAAATTAFSVFVFLVMLKSSIVEAFEALLVIFPAAATTGNWVSIFCGVGLAILLISGGAFLLHGHLQKIPEVKMKLMTGILLSAIGISWLLELNSSP